MLQFNITTVIEFTFYMFITILIAYEGYYERIKVNVNLLIRGWVYLIIIGLAYMIRNKYSNYSKAIFIIVCGLRIYSLQ
jgi:hypothetical protein